MMWWWFGYCEHESWDFRVLVGTLPGNGTVWLDATAGVPDLWYLPSCCCRGSEPRTRFQQAGPSLRPNKTRYRPCIVGIWTPPTHSLLDSSYGAIVVGPRRLAMPALQRHEQRRP